jgi:hypothetical protein
VHVRLLMKVRTHCNPQRSSADVFHGHCRTARNPKKHAGVRTYPFFGAPAYGSLIYWGITDCLITGITTAIKVSHAVRLLDSGSGASACHAEPTPLFAMKLARALAGRPIRALIGVIHLASKPSSSGEKGLVIPPKD